VGKAGGKNALKKDGQYLADKEIFKTGGRKIPVRPRDSVGGGSVKPEGYENCRKKGALCRVRAQRHCEFTELVFPGELGRQNQKEGLTQNTRKEPENGVHGKRGQDCGDKETTRFHWKGGGTDGDRPLY